MNSERWQKVRSLFDAVVELEPRKCKQLLDKSCGTDEELRCDVENLLASYNDAESFMEQAAVVEFAGLVIEPKNLETGKSFGHYEIIKQIGEGGMGEVYLAKDSRLNRSVALKLLAAHITEDQNRVSRFRQEAFATSALNHPNIVTIYEIGEWRGRDFIVTEFIEGMTLRDVLRAKKLSIGEALDIALQTASALAAAHGAGIVHRDIKPENIMIRPDGLVKILDFGIAKYLPSDEHQALVKTEVGEVIGTAAYMSPEQARGLEIDARTDVWSLGVILYEMIARKLPFAGQTKSDRIAAILEHEPAPLSKTRRQIPPQLEKIVSRALSKEKKERYAEMAEMAEDLNGLRDVTGDKRPAAFVLPARKSAAPPRTYLYAALATLLVGVIGFGWYFWSVNKPASNAAGKKSLAVLPFINVNQDPNAEYLSDGVTESIINNLSQLSNLKVMSRSSAFRFKNNQTDTINIAAQLGVETLVTGDVKQIGDKFVINVRLIDATDDSQIWGNQYVKTSADIIAAQNEIAQAVADSLRLKLTNSEQQQLAKRYTDNVEAYQLYLKGRYHIFKLTPPEIQKGMAYFQQAIEIDPNYALAYVGISDAYRSFALSGETPSTEVMPKAKAAVNKALEIDPALAEAHSSLSSIIFWYEWDWNAAENEIKRSIELNPNNADAHIFYAYILSNTGRHKESLAEAKRAGELDPLSLVVSSLEGLFLFQAGQPDEALAKLQKTFEMDSNFALAHLFAASVYIEKGMYAEAVAEARRMRELNTVSSGPVAFLGYALAKSGKRAEARKLLDEMLKESARQYLSPYHIALIYNALDERDETFAWLERGFEKRDVRMAFLKVEPKWNNLRDDPRFASLLKRMNFE